MNITVAIPSYNKENYIQRCIDSALANKDYIAKIILVDNHSSDKTLALAKDYEPSIVCYQNEENLGMAKNWNRCIELCDTEWLLILHADDELLPGAIKQYINFIQHNPTAGLIHANSYSVIEGDISTKSFTIKKQKAFWKAGLEAMKCHYGVCSAVMVNMNVYKKLGTFVESLSSDAEMWSRIASKYDVGFIEEPTVVYHVSKTSTGFQGSIKRSIFAIKRDTDHLYELITSHYPTKESREAYWNTFLAGCPGNYYALAKINIKAGNYYNVLQALFLIIFFYRGLVPLIRLIFADCKKAILSSKLQLKH